MVSPSVAAIEREARLEAMTPTERQEALAAERAAADRRADYRALRRAAGRDYFLGHGSQREHFDAR